MKVYDDLTQYDAQDINLRNSLIYTTVINFLIFLTHITILGVIIAVIIFLATTPSLDIPPFILLCLCLIFFVIFIGISIWLHYQLKLKYSQCFKATITLPLLRRLFKSTTYSQTCDCTQMLRIPNILDNTWRTARINDYFDGYNQDYERNFEFFDFQLFVADTGTDSAIYSGHLLVIELPWQIEKPCTLFHKNLFRLGNTPVHGYAAFEVPEFAQKFALNCPCIEENALPFQTQKQINATSPKLQPEIKKSLSKLNSVKKRIKPIFYAEDQLLGEFESARKITIQPQTSEDEVPKAPQNSAPKLDITENILPVSSMHNKPSLKLEDLFSRQFAKNIISAEARLQKDLHIYMQGDRMFVYTKSNADILEPHFWDFMRSKIRIEKRIFQELLPIIDMISVSQSHVHLD